MSTEIALTIIFTTLVILLLIAGIAIIIVIANRQRVKREVEFEKELRNVEQEVQEELLTNVSQELHDNIGQMLTVMHLQIKKRQVQEPEATHFLKPISDTLNETVDQVRALARGLNSEMIQNNGLTANIEQEVNRLAKLGKFQIDWTCDHNKPELSKDSQLLVFRIYQEVMNNIMKHAEATKVSVKMSSAPFSLSVTDNGIGFDFNKHSENQTSMGLSNIAKRAKLAGLMSEMITSEGKGCIFIIKQP